MLLIIAATLPTLFIQITAATVAFSYWCFLNTAQDWYTEQLMYVICASCVTNGTPSQGTNTVTSALPMVSHTQCSTDSWLLQVCLCRRIPSTGVCCSTSWLRKESPTKGFSYTDLSKSRTKAFKFHLAIFVFLNFPCAFFPLATLCWLESALTHKDVCWQGQDKIAEFLSLHVIEPSTKAYDCYLTKDP